MAYPQYRGQTDKVHNTGYIIYGGDGTNFYPILVDSDGKLIQQVPVITPTTGTGTTLANLTPGAAFHLLGIRIHVGSALASAETLTVTNNSGTASAYDTLLFTLDMGTPDIRDVVIPFGGDEDFFGASDVIDIVLSANAGGDTWGCETIHELV